MIQTTIVGYGEKSERQAKTYMNRLRDYMPEYYPSIGWKVYEETVQRGAMYTYLQALENKVLTYHPNIVLVECTGLETDLDHDSFLGTAAYEEQLKALIQCILAHNNRTGLNNCIPIPVLITPPPIDEAKVKTNRTNNRLGQYAYRIKQVAKRYECPVVDLFEALNTAEEPFAQYMSEDGCHLNAKGEDLLYDLIFRELTKLITYQGVLKERRIPS